MFSTRRKTYRASTVAVLVAAVTVDRQWWSMGGSSSKRISLQKITLFCPTLTASEVVRVKLIRYVHTANTAASGSNTALAAVPMESGNGASTLGFHRVNTSSDTALGAGTASIVARKRQLILVPALTVSDSRTDIVFGFQDMDEAQAPKLDGLLEEFHLQWATAPASAVTMDIEVEWLEEG